MKLQKNYFWKMLCAILLLAGLVTACYDDSDVRELLHDHESRLKELERLTAQQNTNISSLQTIVTALQDKDYVTNVSPINEGDKVLGYTITFSKSGAVTIYNGKDGYVPVMGVKQEESDGQWYWTVDGEWLLDSKGDQVRASALDGEDGEPGTPGQPGVTPTLKIVDGYWYVSYDGGRTWEDETLGQATGDKGYTMFEKVEYDDEHLYITMADGEKLTLPRTSAGQGAEGPLTWSLDKVTAFSATFSGHLDVPASDLSFSKVTVYYSDAETFNVNTARSVSATSFDKDQNFTITLTGLEYGANYNYCIVAEVKSEKMYGEVLNFTTENVTLSELSAGSITATTAQITGIIEGLSESEKSLIEVGLLYSSESGQVENGQGTKLAASEIPSDNAVSFDLSDLMFGTKYYYCSYVKQNSRIAYGQTKDFTTMGLPDLKLEDIKIEAEVMTVTISGKIAGIEDVDISKVSLECSLTDGSYNSHISSICDQITVDGEFRFVFEMNCKESLEHNVEYSYDLSISYDFNSIGDTVYGSFHTYVPKGSVTLSSVSCNSAEFVGTIEDFAELNKCPSRTPDGKIQVGIYYSQNPINDPKDAKKRQGVLNDDGTFTVSLNNLIPETSYYWGLVIVHNTVLSRVVFGEVKEFTTLKDPYDQSYDLDSASAIDLSSTASANCYIISESGLYKFKPVKGNSNESVGGVASANILWETFGTDTAPEPLDLVGGACYKDGYIVFQTADTFKEGNAVIAAKDSEGNILWSWHIWFTDEPQGQEYYNNAGTMMDRNLGATSATPGDIGALGLLYQWGRKDPFLGSSSISDDVAKSTIIWPSSVESDSSNGTIAYAIANPTTFIGYNDSNYDWYYTGDSSTDNTRWTTSESSKSIYDPCPVGWRVPDGGYNGIWSKALGSSSSFDYTYDSTNEGMNFSGKFGSDQTIWYPASGYRYYYDGCLSIVSYYGFYWSASPYSSSAYNLYFSYYGSVLPSYSYRRALGGSVRCLQESK